MSTHFCARAGARVGPPGPCIVARWLVTRIGINLNLNRAECVGGGDTWDVKLEFQPVRKQFSTGLCDAGMHALL